MKTLIVCSYRSYAKYTDYVAPFIFEQVNSLRKQGIDVEYFRIRGGVKAYVRAIFRIIRTAKESQVDIIHAHGGLCGFVSVMQNTIPVVTTYHGSDINNNKTRFLSMFSIKKSTYNIFVSQKLVDLAKPPKKNYQVVPCGVDVNVFYPLDKDECRKKFNFKSNKKYILFSKAFYVKVKNYPLAKAAVDKLNNVELIELDGYERNEVNLLMNACDVALMTSFTEGSPQFIKESMAVNCPIVSTDVGDVKDVIEGIENCYICEYEPNDVAEKIKRCLNLSSRNENSRKKIMDNYNLDTIAKRIVEIYRICLQK